ncbi:MAG: ABC transporter permease [Acidimicrobiia bacterium]|nr:ABC transporter permease [Acidimicrobiia bacterium]
MTYRRQVFELAKRDFVQRAKSKAFLMSMVLIIGVVLMIGPLLAFADRDPGPTYVGLVGDLPTGSVEAIRLQADFLDYPIELRTYPDLAAVEQAIVEGEISAAINGLDEVIFRDEVSLRLEAVLTGGVANAQRQTLAADLGLTLDEVDVLLFPVAFDQRTLEPAETDEDNARQAAAIAGLMLLYISILIFGQFVMMGVMEEKQTRVVEVVLSRVKPTQILIGKVIGIGLLGLIQIVALGGAALLTLSVVDIADIDLTNLGIEVLGLLVLWYLLGYAFYSVMYGALGATISRQEDMQGVAMLPVLLILPGFFIAQLAIASPEGWLARVTSLVPVWSPMVMAVRSVVSDVATWEVAASILLLLLTTYGLVALGGRIYRGAILQTATKTKLRAAWRSASG